MNEPDKAEQATAELRELIREAHAAIKDLTRVLREVRQAVRDGTAEARDTMAKAANDAIDEFTVHWQKQADQAAADLNRDLLAARAHLIKALTIKSMEGIPGERGIRVEFAGQLFDDGTEDTGPAGP